jgi:hypothetical protein
LRLSLVVRIVIVWLLVLALLAVFYTQYIIDLCVCQAILAPIYDIGTNSCFSY